MMAQKHLHELLREDQEPFKLHNYIADRRCQLKRPPTQHPKKLHKTIIKTSSSRSNLCKQACFFSFQDSPDVRKSPCPSQAKSPYKGENNSVFLHIPAKTAAVLVEAAIKIQKQSSKPKGKTYGKNVGFGLFGSFLKRFKDKNNSKKNESSLTDDPIVENRKSTKKMEKLEENVMGFSSSCNDSRVSSADWSESNEDKSLDMETSCSTSRSDYTEEIEFASSEKHFFSSPMSSPFRFALQRSPSSGHRTPDFFSRAASPSLCNTEESHNQEAENLQKIQLEEEEEKDQCSPVSVLDPPFEDYDDERDAGDEAEEDDYDLECSYAIVQRAKLQLLHKLRRFERMADLEPIELEKRMLEEHYDEDDNDDLVEEEECDEVDESRSIYIEENTDEFITEIFSRSGFCNLNKIPGDMNRLVLDLLAEEKQKGLENNDVEMMNMVCKRLDSWKEVETNTIDMMVELDLRREGNEWKSYEEELGEKAKETELAIFGLLMEELAEELVKFAKVSV